MDQRHHVEVNVHWFAQSDAGGNPYQREGLRYLGERTAVSLQLTDDVRVRAAVTVADLEDGGTDDDVPFNTISNASSTQASKNQTPVTTQLYADFKVGDHVTVTPGAYYFTQSDHKSFGGSLDLSLELNGGDTVPFLGVQLLSDRLELDYWDGSERGRDRRLALSLVAGVTQTLGANVVGTISTQYVHQQGFLGDPINVVPIFNGFIPVLLGDERLPRRRDRFQFNARLRYSFMRGWSAGVDASYYLDSWSMQHGALEPSIEAAIVPDVWILRVWSRVAFQAEARDFDKRRQSEGRHQTRDADLGTFTSLGIGVYTAFRLGTYAGITPELHGSFLFYDRNDNIDGVLGSGGVAVRF